MAHYSADLAAFPAVAFKSSKSTFPYGPSSFECRLLRPGICKRRVNCSVLNLTVAQISQRNVSMALGQAGEGAGIRSCRSGLGR